MPRRSVAAVFVCVFLTACVGPARSDSDYRADVSNTAKTAVSAVESAQLTIQAVVEGKATAAYVSQRLTEDEQEVHAAITAFASVQPPSEDADRLRGEVLSLLQQASTVLAELRIEAFRDDHAELSSIARPLPEIADQLARYTHVGGG